MASDYSELIAAIDVTKHSTVASLAFIIYEYLVTFEDETRYLTIITLLIKVVGKSLPLFRGGYLTKDLHYFSFARLIGGGKVHLQNVGDPLVLCHIDPFLFRYSSGKSMIYAVYDLHPRQTPSGCYPDILPPFMFTIWLLPISFETTLLLLMLYKAWTLYHEKRDFPMLRTLLRDSTLVAFLVSAAFMAALPHSTWSTLSQMANGWVIAIPSAMVGRLLLNMRREYYDRLSSTGSSSNQASSDMELTSLRVAALESDGISSRRMETESSFQSL
ncbi:hypothetical protein BU17DRAFT_70484 [Hysterangium stoloniferum]|nr:hypothetical protein BU17DRAFT_70484 [Hysterangium stoloniferum]